jgi:hypothetical protein
MLLSPWVLESCGLGGYQMPFLATLWEESHKHWRCPGEPHKVPTTWNHILVEETNKRICTDSSQLLVVPLNSFLTW